MIYSLIILGIFLLPGLQSIDTNDSCSLPTKCEYTYDMNSPFQCFCDDKCTNIGKRLLCYYIGKLKNNCASNCTSSNMISSCGKLCCYRDCQPELWQEWSQCQGPCGNKTATRSRQRIVKSGKTSQCGGLECPLLNETETCLTECCKTDCQWTSWSVWSECNNTCGNGSRNSSRTHLQEASCGGLNCSGEYLKIETCSSYKNVDCIMDSWTSWSSCYLKNSKCGAGSQNRSRSIIRQQECQGIPCEAINETIACEGPCCKLDCSMSVWTAWSFCNVSCGNGYQNRSRYVQQIGLCGGSICSSDLFQNQSCVKNETRNCTMTPWSVLSVCSNSCGSGYKTSKRSIFLDDACGGTTCSTNLTIQQDCESYTANVNCKVSPWSNWTECVRNCERGESIRTRSILAIPKCNGTICPSIRENTTCHPQCSQLCNNGVCSCNKGFELQSNGYECSQKFCYTLPNVQYSPPGLTKSIQFEFVRYSCQSIIKAGDVCTVNCSNPDWVLRGDVNNFTCQDTGYFNNQSMYCGPRNFAPTNISLDVSKVTEEIQTYPCFGKLTTTDANDLIKVYNYSLTENFENRLKIIDDRLCLNYIPNYEAPNNKWEILVRSRDQGDLYYDKHFNISLINTNDPPSSCRFDTDATIPENVGLWYFVGNLIFEDEDGDEAKIKPFIIYSDSDNFEIFYNDTNGLSLYGVRVKTVASTNCQDRGGPACNLNYEIKNKIVISIEADEEGIPNTSNYFDIFINLQDQNDEPTKVFLNVSQIPENLKPGDLIGSFNIEDEDNMTQSYEYTLIQGNPDYFRIDEKKNLILLKTINFEDTNLPNLNIIVEGKDNGTPSMSVTSEIIFRVKNIDEPSEVTYVSNSVTVDNVYQIEIQENTEIGSKLASVYITDPDIGEELIYEIPGGSDNILIQDNGCTTENLQIQQTNCVIDIKSKIVFNYEIMSSFYFNVTIKGRDGLESRVKFRISVSNRNDRPMSIIFAESNSSTMEIKENEVGINISMLASVDEDKINDNQFVLIEDKSSLFEILADGMIRLKDGKFLDFEGTSKTNIIVVGLTNIGDPQYKLEWNLTIAAQNVNEPPTNILLSNSMVYENASEGFIVGLLQASDIDIPDNHTFTIITGSSSSYYIESNQLKITKTNQSKLDYENSNEDTLQIQTTDGGSLTFLKSFKIDILDSNEPPTSLSISNNRIEENARIGTFIGQCSAFDEDRNQTIHYKINGINSQFILSSDGRLDSNTLFDYEMFSSTTVSILYFDDGSTSLTSSISLNIQIIDVNEAPYFEIGHSLNVSVKENNVTDIGNLIIVDPDHGASLEFKCTSISPVVDCPITFVESSCQNTIANKTRCITKMHVQNALNYEKVSEYEIGVEVTDKGGLHDVLQVHLQVDNVNEDVSEILFNGVRVESINVNENEKGVVLGLFTFIDPDLFQKHTVSIINVSPSDDEKGLEIKDNVLQMHSNFSFDYERCRNYTISLNVTDNSTFPLYQVFSMHLLVSDVNESPSAIYLSNYEIAENSPNGTVVATLSATDADNVISIRQLLTFSLIHDELDAFEITGNELKIKDNGKINFEIINRTKIIIEVIDNGTMPLSFSVEKELIITDVNEPPEDIALLDNILEIEAPNDTIVGNVSFTDQDINQFFTFSLVPVEHRNYTDFFRISQVGEIVKTTSTKIEEEKIELDVRISDNGVPVLSTTKTVQLIIVTKMMHAYNCTIILNETLSKNNKINEDVKVGSLIGTMEVSLDSDSNIDIIVPISAETSEYTTLMLPTCLKYNGQQNCSIDMILDKSLDYETKSSININSRLSSKGGNRVNLHAVLEVNDINEPPTNIISIPGKMVVKENSKASVVICQFLFVDQDKNDIGVFEFKSNFSQIQLLNNSFLTTSSTNFDFEKNEFIEFEIKVTDGGGLSFSKIFRIEIIDENEIPQDMNPKSIQIFENVTDNAIVAILDAIDVDRNQTYSYQIFNNLKGNFKIANNKLKISINRTSCAQNGQSCPPNFEKEPKKFNVSIIVTDSGQPPLSSTFVISVTILDSNDPPTAIILDQRSIKESADINETVGRITVIDEDVVDDHRCVVLSESSFYINANLELVLAKKINYEDKSIYQVSIKCMDSQNQSFSQIFQITVIDVNEPPNDASTSTSEISKVLSVKENSPRGFIIGYIYTYDEDNNDLLYVNCNSEVVYCKNLNCENRNTSGTVCETRVEIRDRGDFNFEKNSSISLSISVIDKYNMTFRTLIWINITNVDEEPTDIMLNGSSGFNVVIMENSKNIFIGELTAIDEDIGDHYNFFILEDISTFFIIINETMLWTKSDAAFNFESLSSYYITVGAMLGNEIKINKTVFITVANVNEAPSSVFLSKSMVLEDVLPMTKLELLNAEDPDNPQGKQTFTYRLLSHNSTFTIHNGELMLLQDQMLDYENQSQYLIKIEVVDSGIPSLSATFEIKLDVGDVNESPENLEITSNIIDENSPIRTMIGTLSAEDPDFGSKLSYATPMDESNFIIENNVLFSGKSFDYELVNKYQINITVSDNGDPVKMIWRVFEIFIMDVNEMPHITIKNMDGLVSRRLLVPENNQNGTAIGIIYVNDPEMDSAILCSIYPEMAEFSLEILSESLVNSSFLITTQYSFDFEIKNEFVINFNATDSSNLTDTAIVRIQVTDVNEPPFSITVDGDNASMIFINENVVGSQRILSLTVEDPDRGDDHRFYVDNCSNCPGKFKFVDDKRLLYLIQGEFFNFELMKDTDIEITVKAVDSGNLSTTRTMTIVIVDVNDPPTIQGLNISSIPSYFEGGHEFVRIGVNDEDVNPESYEVKCQLHNNPDWLVIVNVDKTNILKSTKTMYLNQSDIPFEIRCFDNNSPPLGGALNVTLEIQNTGNEPIVLVLRDVVIQINENEGNITLGHLCLQTKFSNQSLPFNKSDVDHSWPSQLNITIADDGTVTLLSPVNYEDIKSFDLVFTLLNNPNTGTIRFAISVLNINDKPTAIMFKTGRVAVLNKQGSGVLIGTIVAIDEDSDQRHYYEIMTIFGTTKKSAAISKMDSSVVTMNGDKMVTGPMNLSAASNLTVTIKCTDNGAPALSAEFELFVLVQINESPTEIIFAATNFSVQENTTIHSSLVTFYVLDDDGNDNHTCTSSNEQFQISNYSILLGKKLDYEATQLVSTTITCVDAGGLSVISAWSVIVTNIDESPENAVISNVQWDEHLALDTLIGYITAVDPEGAQCRYELLRCENMVCPFIIFENGSVILNQLLTEVTSTDDLKFDINVYDQTDNNKTFQLGVTIIRHNLPTISIYVKNVNNIPESTPVGTKIFDVDIIFPTGKSNKVFCKATTVGDFVIFNIFEALLDKFLDYELNKVLSVNVTCWKNMIQMLNWINVVLNVTDVNEPIKEIVLNISQSILEGSHINDPIGNIIIKDPENDPLSVKCHGILANLSFVPSETGDHSILSYLVAITGDFDFENLVYGYNFSIVCEDSVSSLEKNVSLYIENMNEPPSDLLIQGSTTIDLDTLRDFDKIATLTVLDQDRDQAHNILVQGSGDKYFYITENQDLRVKNLEYSWIGKLDCSFQVLDNGIPPLKAVFVKSFNIIKSNGEIRLSTYIIDISATANTCLASVTFISNSSSVKAYFKLVDVADNAFYLNGSSLCLVTNADKLPYAKVNLRIIAYNEENDQIITEANVRLEIIGFSVCHTSLNNCSINSTCQSMDGDKGFACVCKEGFLKLNDACTEIDECKDTPCLGNNSLCLDLINDFHCTCQSNRHGKMCEMIDSTLCGTNECVHGNCKGNTCTCSIGWEGQACNDSVNDCTEHSCGINDVCEDRDQGFICLCEQGFHGVLCQYSAYLCEGCDNEDDCILDARYNAFCVVSDDKIRINFMANNDTLKDVPYFTSMFYRFLQLMPEFKDTSIYLKTLQIDDKTYQLAIAAFDEFGSLITDEDSWSIMREKCLTVLQSPEREACQRVFESFKPSSTSNKNYIDAINFSVILVIPILVLLRNM